jgi:hypothetical protein
MELKEFVAQSLVQIIEGVREAQTQIVGENEAKPGGKRAGSINPHTSNRGEKIRERETTSNWGESVRLVSFDVAVTVQEGAGASTPATKWMARSL